MDILGIGNALIDVYCFVNEDFPSSLGFHKGTVNHVGQDRIRKVLESLQDPVIMAGGGAANTMKLAARLGLETGFIGMIGDGHAGSLFESSLSQAGVRTILARCEEGTGVCCTLLGSDSRRTHIVSPGAALGLTMKDVSPERIRAAGMLYLELFPLASGTVPFEAAEYAKVHGIPVAVDLSSAGIVRSNRDAVLEMVRNNVEILFATQEEATALFGRVPDEGELAELCDTVVLKRGSDGVSAFSGEISCSLPAPDTVAIDTSGAGDAFAAAFLASHIHSLPLETCCSIGTLIAKEIIGIPGTELDERSLSRVRDAIDGEPVF